MLTFGREFHVYFVVVFSARALRAGIRPGPSSPTVSTALTMGWTGWKFVAVITIKGYKLFFYLLLLPSASARNKI